MFKKNLGIKYLNSTYLIKTNYYELISEVKQLTIL